MMLTSGTSMSSAGRQAGSARKARRAANRCQAQQQCRGLTGCSARGGSGSPGGPAGSQRQRHTCTCAGTRRGRRAGRSPVAAAEAAQAQGHGQGQAGGQGRAHVRMCLVWPLCPLTSLLILAGHHHVKVAPVCRHLHLGHRLHQLAHALPQPLLQTAAGGRQAGGGQGRAGSGGSETAGGDRKAGQPPAPHTALSLSPAGCIPPIQPPSNPPTHPPTATPPTHPTHLVLGEDVVVDEALPAGDGVGLQTLATEPVQHLQQQGQGQRRGRGRGGGRQ